MAKEDLIKRDGSAALGGPRRPVPERPAKEPAEAETGLKEFGGYGDSKVVGHFDETAVLKAAHGNPSPRQRAMQGEKVVTTSKTEDPFPAPLD
jgi:hypothetical protein